MKIEISPEEVEKILIEHITKTTGLKVSSLNYFFTVEGYTYDTNNSDAELKKIQLVIEE